MDAQYCLQYVTRAEALSSRESKPQHFDRRSQLMKSTTPVENRDRFPSRHAQSTILSAPYTAPSTKSLPHPTNFMKELSGDVTQGLSSIGFGFMNIFMCVLRRLLFSSIGR